MDLNFAFWLSLVLAAMGCTGLLLAGKGKWYGWGIGLAVQPVWATYAIVTKGYGLLLTCLMYGFVNARNLLKWRREQKIERQSRCSHSASEGFYGDVNNYINYRAACPSCGKTWPSIEAWKSETAGVRADPEVEPPRFPSIEEMQRTFNGPAVKVEEDTRTIFPDARKRRSIDWLDNGTAIEAELGQTVVPIEEVPPFERDGAEAYVPSTLADIEEIVQGRKHEPECALKAPPQHDPAMPVPDHTGCTCWLSKPGMLP